MLRIDCLLMFIYCLFILDQQIILCQFKILIVGLPFCFLFYYYFISFLDRPANSYDTLSCCFLFYLIKK